MTTKVRILKCEQLCTNLEEHSLGRHYMFQLKKCFNAPINDILRNEARIDVDEKAGEYQRVVEDLILYDAKTVQNLKDILLAVPSLSEEVNNQLRSKLEASACCNFRFFLV